MSRWIPAGGGIANVIVGCLFIGALRMFRPTSQHVRYFLVLGIAFNLLRVVVLALFVGVVGPGIKFGA